MQATASSAPKRSGLFALILIVLPIFLFYWILFSNAVRIPILDDYDIILGSLIWTKQHPGFLPKLLFLFTAQHNGYKLMFENAVVLLEYSLVGRIYIYPLVIIGNLFPVVLFLTVVRMTRFHTESGARNWILMVPIAWIVFQLQYASALDFASSSLQHLAVIAFSLLAVLLLTQATAWTLIGSCCCLILAIASSPNGFFVVPVGLLLLLQKGRWKDLSFWLLTTGLMLFVYLFRYSHSAGVTGAGGETEHFAHFNAWYALSFLGASAAGFSSILPSMLLGTLFAVIFVLALQRRYFRANPPVFYSMLFILINALAVSGLRSDLGVVQSLASRYRTYSNLYLAFSYIFVVESLLPAWHRRGARRAFVVGSAVLAVAFCGLSDRAGARFLRGKKVALTESYRAEWQGRAASPDASLAAVNPAFQRQMAKGIYSMNLPVFRQAVEDGIFQPPQNP